MSVDTTIRSSFKPARAPARPVKAESKSAPKRKAKREYFERRVCAFRVTDEEYGEIMRLEGAIAEEYRKHGVIPPLKSDILRAAIMALADDVRRNGVTRRVVQIVDAGIA